MSFARKPTIMTIIVNGNQLWLRTVTKCHNKSIWSNRMWWWWKYAIDVKFIDRTKRMHIGVIHTSSVCMWIRSKWFVVVISSSSKCANVFFFRLAVVCAVQHFDCRSIQLIVQYTSIIKCHKCRVKELVSILLAAIIISIKRKRHDTFTLLLSLEYQTVYTGFHRRNSNLIYQQITCVWIGFSSSPSLSFSLSLVYFILLTFRIFDVSFVYYIFFSVNI